MRPRVIFYIICFGMRMISCCAPMEKALLERPHV